MKYKPRSTLISLNSWFLHLWYLGSYHTWLHLVWYDPRYHWWRNLSFRQIIVDLCLYHDWGFRSCFYWIFPFGYPVITALPEGAGQSTSGLGFPFKTCVSSGFEPGVARVKARRATHWAVLTTSMRGIKVEVYRQSFSPLGPLLSKLEKKTLFLM